MHRRAPLVLLALAALGCRDRASSHHVDDLFLTPEQERDVFVASTDHPGPDTSVVVLAEAPKARYDRGAIVLTGGRELEVVQPHAWRSSTGTALSAEEARRMIDRAQRLDQAMKDIGDAARDLREYLESRAADAKRAGAQLDERDRRQRADAARADRVRDADAAAVVAARDRDLDACAHDRDAAVARADQRLAAEQGTVAAAFDRRCAELDASARRDDEALAQRQRLDLASARDAGKDAAYLIALDRRHAEERARSGEARERERAAIAAERDAALARVRGERDAAADQARRLADERAERIRCAADDQLARIAAERARAASRGTALGGDGPWPGASGTTVSSSVASAEAEAPTATPAATHTSGSAASATPSPATASATPSPAIVPAGDASTVRGAPSASSSAATSTPARGADARDDGGDALPR